MEHSLDTNAIPFWICKKLFKVPKLPGPLYPTMFISSKEVKWPFNLLGFKQWRIPRGREGESPRAALKRGRHFEWGGKRGKIDVTMLCARMKPEGVRTLHLSIIISIFCANRTQNWTAIIYREWVKLALGKANSEDVVHPAPVALAKIGLPDTGRSILCQ